MLSDRMKWVLYLSLFVCLSTNGQGLRIEYSPDSTYVWVTSPDETFSIQGKSHVQSRGFQREYWKDTIMSLHESYFTREQLCLLRTHRSNCVVKLLLTHTGAIEFVIFWVKRDLFQAIPKEVFQNLYNAYRWVKLDVTKGDFYPALDENHYAYLTFRLK